MGRELLGHLAPYVVDEMWDVTQGGRLYGESLREVRYVYQHRPFTSADCLRAVAAVLLIVGISIAPHDTFHPKNHKRTLSDAPRSLTTGFIDPFTALINLQNSQ